MRKLFIPRKPESEQIKIERQAKGPDVRIQSKTINMFERRTGHLPTNEFLN